MLSVRPTLVIAAEGSGPPDALKLVRDAGVPIVTVPEEPTEAGVAARIKAVAHAVGRDREGEALAQSVAERFAALARLRGRIKKRPAPSSSSRSRTAAPWSRAGRPRPTAC